MHEKCVVVGLWFETHSSGASVKILVSWQYGRLHSEYCPFHLEYKVDNVMNEVASLF